MYKKLRLKSFIWLIFSFNYFEIQLYRVLIKNSAVRHTSKYTLLMRKKRAALLYVAPEG